MVMAPATSAQPVLAVLAVKWFGIGLLAGTVTLGTIELTRTEPASPVPLVTSRTTTAQSEKVPVAQPIDEADREKPAVGVRQ
jgi:hypothetical protein